MSAMHVNNAVTIFMPGRRVIFSQYIPSDRRTSMYLPNDLSPSTFWAQCTFGGISEVFPARINIIYTYGFSSPLKRQLDPWQKGVLGIQGYPHHRPRTYWHQSRSTFPPPTRMGGEGGGERV
eukprot:sb/3475979/